jgi:hypothetical protein
MIIEDTINEITEFIGKFGSTFRLLICSPKKLLIYLRYDRYLSLLKAPIFFLIAYFSFLCVYLSNDKGKGVGDRLAFDQLVVNLKDIPEHLTEVQRLLYLSLIFVIVYYSNILVSRLLFVKKENRKIFQNFVLYYASLNIMAFVAIEVLQLIFADKLAALLYNHGILGYTAIGYMIAIIKYTQIILKYALIPLIYLLVIYRTMFLPKPVFIKYLIATLFVIFVVDWVITLNNWIAGLVDPKVDVVLLKGDFNIKQDPYGSNGYLRPVFAKDTLGKPGMLSFDLYIYNHTDSLLVIPKNDTIFIRRETGDDSQNHGSKLLIDEEKWQKFSNSPFVFQATSFENKSDRYQLIQPEEIKWVNFTRYFKTSAEAAQYKAFFLGKLQSATGRVKVYRPSINYRAPSQYWIMHSVTQILIFDNKP